jgi:hypothetical protein
MGKDSTALSVAYDVELRLVNRFDVKAIVLRPLFATSVTYHYPLCCRTVRFPRRPPHSHPS